MHSFAPRPEKKSTHLKRNNHFESGNIDLEDFFVVQVFHAVGAVHFTHLCTEIASAHILIPFAGIQYRLHTYYAFAFHLTIAAIAVKNMPMTAMQFYRKSIMIFYGYTVGK